MFDPSVEKIAPKSISLTHHRIKMINDRPMGSKKYLVMFI